MNNSFYGPLELLIIQGSPFCNINCSYCYLPNRNDSSKLSLETVEAIFNNLFSTILLDKILLFVGMPANH